jgi:hypothetical protein
MADVKTLCATPVEKWQPVDYPQGVISQFCEYTAVSCTADGVIYLFKVPHGAVILDALIHTNKPEDVTFGLYEHTGSVVDVDLFKGTVTGSGVWRADNAGGAFLNYKVSVSDDCPVRYQLIGVGGLSGTISLNTIKAWVMYTMGKPG